jgi:hypothetical protein
VGEYRVKLIYSYNRYRRHYLQHDYLKHQFLFSDFQLFTHFDYHQVKVDPFTHFDYHRVKVDPKHIY